MYDQNSYLANIKRRPCRRVSQQHESVVVVVDVEIVVVEIAVVEVIGVEAIVVELAIDVDVLVTAVVVVVKVCMNLKIII